MRELYDRAIATRRCVKFVPASGAASRMFKALFAHRERLRSTPDASPDVDKTVQRFFDNVEQFAFASELDAALADVGGLRAAAAEPQLHSVLLDRLLHTDEGGLGYGTLPKGLLRFHKYADTEVRTAVEEQLVEGAHYCRGGDGQVPLHFTVAPAHQAGFEEHVESVRGIYEARFNARFNVSYSQQDPATDTIAVTPDKQPFRVNRNDEADDVDDDAEALNEGELLLRPAGHGALLHNLDAVAREADIVFIKVMNFAFFFFFFFVCLFVILTINMYLLSNFHYFLCEFFDTKRILIMLFATS